MGWENRKGRLYYYTKEWIGSRVISHYVRGRETAQLIAEIRRMRQEEREIEHDLKAEALAELEAEDREAERIAEMANTLMKGALIASGFHQHKRSWRRKRNAQS